MSNYEFIEIKQTKGGRNLANTEKQENDEEIIEEVINEDEAQLLDETADDQEAVDDQEVIVDEKEELIQKNMKEIQDLKDRIQRNMAEFDNFRKRTAKEKSMMYENGSKVVLEKMLPIIDNFERAMENVPNDSSADGFVEGINMIYKQLLTTLLDLGVEAIDAEGAEFDPNLHHAVSHEENDEYGENVVVNVLQKGYMFNDKVLRHSMVTVAN
jgi:molecular chaperone GrpE